LDSRHNWKKFLHPHSVTQQKNILDYSIAVCQKHEQKINHNPT